MHSTNGKIKFSTGSMCYGMVSLLNPILLAVANRLTARVILGTTPELVISEFSLVEINAIWIILKLGICSYLAFCSMFRNNQEIQIFISLLFHLIAPTCFGNCVPSSGSSSVPSELHTNFDFWLIKFCVVCGCVYVYIMWRPGAYRCLSMLLSTSTYLDWAGSG
jgi:predicted cobalt transporter CbtA